MPLGRLAWRSPTGAILWEIWARRKINFACHVAGLAVAAASVHAIQHASSEIVQALFKILLLTMFMIAVLDVLTTFAYIEVNAQKVQFSFPRRLLLKPVGTPRLALTPMIAGGVVLVTLLGLWKWIAQPTLPSNLLDPLWLGAVALSFFWWMQALGWSLPYFLGRSLILLALGVAHLFVGAIPLSQFGFLVEWRAAIVVFMLLSALATAVIGLRWMRCGHWEGPSRLGSFWAKFAPVSVRGKFGSAFQAQFWLEWQRQGRVLPLMSAAIFVTVLPVVCLIMEQSLDPGDQTNLVPVAASFLVLMPLMLSGAMGTAMARFDPVRPLGDLPVYIFSRPMTDGGFVLAKLTVALASSALTWLLMVILGLAALLFIRGRHLADLPFGLAGLIAGCVPAILLLVILTWSNLISGIAAGLTGRAWVVGWFSFCKGLGGAGLLGIIMAARFNQDFNSALLRWLLPALSLCLTVKVAFSVVSFRWGLRCNALTPGVVGWILGGWLACGAFVAGYAALVCYALDKPAFWKYGALAGFLLLPLAGLAIAPMAMAWNRHR